MRDRGRRIRPLALQDPLAAGLLPGMSEEDRFASFHLVDAGGTAHSGGAALPDLLGQLAGTRRLGRLMGRAQPLTDLAYELVANNRAAIGRHVPDAWTRRADATIRRREAELGQTHP
jgi:predicted DCC family thiol-disulfide oxidoreductase YuxK